MIRVLRALAAEPGRWRYGYDLGNEVGLKSGSLYPLLVRLADRGLLEASWEPPVQGRPPRHLYRLTSAGLAVLAAIPAAGARPSAARRQRRLREA
jgi:PadR family transcriptional regulator PadR